ncbi:MAG: hypothetical protein JNJ73_01700 [Hyphomonadaceae bacterium]|nr:hypothetical protein [Hyphomonadaceae bacterium]
MLPITLSDAWTTFRYFLRCMAATVEEPAKLAARLYVQAHQRNDILLWLLPLERLARLLLLAEAAAITLSPTAPRRRGPRKEVKGSRLRPVPEESEEWRVAFKAAAGAKRRSKRAARAARRTFAATVHDAVPLAARIEALIRVALDPAPYAKRLARRLSKRPLSRKQARRLFRPANLETPLGRPFEHALPGFMALAAPARFRFESG